jgi:hypothetical protein
MAKTFTCKNCHKKQDTVGVSSKCTQTLHIETDNWTNLDVGETLEAFCLECGTVLTKAQMKKLELEGQ